NSSVRSSDGARPRPFPLVSMLVSSPITMPPPEWRKTYLAAYGYLPELSTLLSSTQKSSLTRLFGSGASCSLVSCHLNCRPAETFPADRIFVTPDRRESCPRGPRPRIMALIHSIRRRPLGGT